MRDKSQTIQIRGKKTERIKCKMTIEIRRHSKNGEKYQIIKYFAKISQYIEYIYRTEYDLN